MNPLIAHNADHRYSQERSVRLADVAVQPRFANFLDEDIIGFLDDTTCGIIDLSPNNPDPEARPREWLTPDKLFG